MPQGALFPNLLFLDALLIDIIANSSLESGLRGFKFAGCTTEERPEWSSGGRTCLPTMLWRQKALKQASTLMFCLLHPEPMLCVTSPTMAVARHMIYQNQRPFSLLSIQWLAPHTTCLLLMVPFLNTLEIFSATDSTCLPHQVIWNVFWKRLMSTFKFYWAIPIKEMPFYLTHSLALMV